MRENFGKFGEFYQIIKLYLPNILQFNYYYQYFNVFTKLYFTKLIFYNFSLAKLSSYTVPTVYEYLLYITLYLTCKFIIMLYIGVYFMQVLIINMFTQNSSPLVKSTMMSLLLMILKRSSDAIQWYNDTVGNNETAGNSSNIVMCSLSFMG